MGQETKEDKMAKPCYKKLKELPELPGVYQMLDSSGNIIYIGKSKCLKKRVHSYFVESPVWEKARKMAPFIYDIYYIVTDTHLEAMLLECEMIKRKRPHFNAAMKNDERYVYLTVSEEKKGKLLKITGEREKFSVGPFRSRSRLQQFMDSLENFYPFTESRKKLQFEYHIFPEKLIEKEREETIVFLKRLFVSVETMQQFQDLLEKKMKKAARKQKFETAMKYRDLLEGSDYIRRNLREYHEWMNQQVVYRENTPKGKKYFFIYDGIVVNRSFYTEQQLDKGNNEQLRDVDSNPFVLLAASEEELEAAEETWLKKFIRDSRNKIGETEQMTEKQLADYRDIVFSECRKVPFVIFPEMGNSINGKRK